MRIISKTKLNSEMWKIVLDSPLIASKALPGNFAFLKMDETAEGAQLAINDPDPAKGTITVIFQETDQTAPRLEALNEGDLLPGISGPAGEPVDFGYVGNVLLVADGAGIADIISVARYAKEMKNRVVTILSARTKDLLILENELKKYSDKLITSTSDGSYGRKGPIIEPLEDIIRFEPFNICYTAVPETILKAVCNITNRHRLKTIGCGRNFRDTSVINDRGA